MDRWQDPVEPRPEMKPLLLRKRGRRRLVPAFAFGLTLLFVLALLPLSRRAARVEEPLDQAWRKLSAGLNITNNLTVDFAGIQEQLEVSRHALETLEAARALAEVRTDPGEEVRQRLSAPFQFVDYAAERGQRIEELRRLASRNKVRVEAPVFAAFPEHTFEVRNPRILWAQLAAVDSILRTAILCRISTVHALQSFAPVTTETGGGTSRTLTEIPVEIEVTGAENAIALFLRSLPGREDEWPHLGTPDEAPVKPAVFIDHLLLRKQAPEKTDEVRAALRLVCFLFNE